MAEYIEREAVLAEAYYDGNFNLVIPAKKVRNIPAADVAPVRHGKWKRSGALLECQRCGEIYSQLGGNAGKSWNYCPNCGCKMDLEEAKNAKQP